MRGNSEGAWRDASISVSVRLRLVSRLDPGLQIGSSPLGQITNFNLDQRPESPTFRQHSYSCQNTIYKITAMSKKAAVPDAWDDDWEATIDASSNACFKCQLIDQVLMRM